MIKTKKDVADALRSLVEADGRKYELLEAAASLPRGAVDGLLRGRNNPGLLRAVALVRALGGSLDQIFAVPAANQANAVESEVSPLSPAEVKLIKQRREIRGEGKNPFMDEVLSGWGAAFGADRSTAELLYALLVRMAGDRGRVVSRNPKGQVSVGPAPKGAARSRELNVAEKGKRYRP